jgi:prepilin-type N-terminal cleavage/methylation domain-containing protein
MENKHLSVVRCQSSVEGRRAANHGPRTTDLAPRAAFTLVELLVVITIIGILAALLVTAAIGAMARAQEARIKSEVNQIDLFGWPGGLYPQKMTF